ncbi:MULTISPECIES: hypothetical protein [unclassified Vibrio]|uniref:hypothetical protein n=1 Tax=unclassified Vibrio TaxID=2614977 RepID=UPI0014822D6D|nr:MULTISPECIES: hypothetical protein [unclassified Vibrio]NNN45351.1 hypothetical protein [Vibrio sp. 1-1(7)]NNN73365.1 hypothetical protein [Vibrio sp. 12-2(3-a)]
MGEINFYISKQRNYIAALMQQPLSGFTNQKNDPATWEDSAWRYTLSSGKYMDFYFVDNTVKNTNFKSNYSSVHLLPDDLRHLMMIYAIEICAGNTSIKNKKDKHAASRRLIAELADNPAHVTFSELEPAYFGLSKRDRGNLPHFFEWLHKCMFIPKTLKLPTRASKIESLVGDDIIEHKKNKIPETKVLLALGTIFYDVIPPEREKWNTHPLAFQRDAYICAMVSLAMGSPNRIDAEQTVLAKQRLQKLTQTVKGKIEVTHYLDWQGSKGFENYHNHILSVMSEPIDRSLEYMELVCEPAKVLARFYENPLLPLKKVLGDFCPSDRNINALNPDMNKPINLIHLGYLLGFYDEGDGFVRVSQATNNAERKKVQRGSNKYIKPIVSLQPDDELMIVSYCPYGKYLLGTSIKPGVKKIFSREKMTIAQFQDIWVKYVISNLAGFPVGYNKSHTGKCKYKYALFSFTGNQMITNNPAYIGGKSHFAIVPLSSLGDVFIRSVNPSQAHCLTDSIFAKHGFSHEFRVKPHQFRHWNNDVADREGIPHAIINLWSGRKTPEQILHYIHRTHAEKSSEISDILFNDTGQEIIVKVMSQLEYEELTKTATAVTSTGFCSQNLQFSPCEYLNDFITQCSLCPSSCHVAHDEKALRLLNKDLQVQLRRLEDAEQRPNFCVSKATQDWFLVHHRNTSMLRELIQLMESKDIKEGAIIRVLAGKNEIRITDTQKKTVTVQKLALPNSDEALAKALEFRSEKSPVDNSLDDILALI